MKGRQYDVLVKNAICVFICAIFCCRKRASNREENTETFDGLIARAIQHEVDHLNGILIIDRVSNVSKIPFENEIRKIKQSSSEKSKLKIKPQIYL